MTQMSPFHSTRQVSSKLDQLMSGGGQVQRGVETPSVVSDIAQIKTTQSNILYQLNDLRCDGGRVWGGGGEEWVVMSSFFFPLTCRSAIDRTAAPGRPVATSEQLQPVYETKNLVQQNAVLLKAVEQHLKVLCVHLSIIGRASVWACEVSF